MSASPKSKARIARTTLIFTGFAIGVMFPSGVISGLHELSYIPVHAAEKHFAGQPAGTPAPAAAAVTR